MKFSIKYLLLLTFLAATSCAIGVAWGSSDWPQFAAIGILVFAPTLSAFLLLPFTWVTEIAWNRLVLCLLFVLGLPPVYFATMIDPGYGAIAFLVVLLVWVPQIQIVKETRFKRSERDAE